MPDEPRPAKVPQTYYEHMPQGEPKQMALLCYLTEVQIAQQQEIMRMLGSIGKMLHDQMPSSMLVDPNTGGKIH
jgi:hypothetical protein